MPPFQQHNAGGDILVGDILAGIAQLMDDAVLDFCPRIHRLDRGGKAGQIVRAGDENILNTPVFQAVKHRSPELSALIFTDPHTKNVLFAV